MGVVFTMIPDMGDAGFRGSGTPAMPGAGDVPTLVRQPVSVLGAVATPVQQPASISNMSLMLSVPPHEGFGK